MRLGDLATPCAVVDHDVLARNCARMASRAHELGVRLRPHVKTHGSPDLARLQVEGHFGGVTVATLGEARAFAEAGFSDLTWAVPCSLARLGDALDLAARVERLSLLVADEDAAGAIELAAAARGRRASVFLEVDCGDHRSGVDPARPGSARLAARLASSPALDFRGILTHAGQSYEATTAPSRQAVARTERDVAVSFAARLRAEGIEVPEVSVGSTPTLTNAQDLSGVTEVRPGNYAYFDLFQAALGTCSPQDLAFSVLASVIAVHAERGVAVLDAGATALSKDAGATHVTEAPGFGLATRADRSPGGPWRLARISQEHGVIELAGTPGPAPRWGERLRIQPNHSCLAARLHDVIHVVRDGRVVADWTVARGW